jgi:hypothetical protein
MMRKVTLAGLTVLILILTAAPVAAQPNVVGQWDRLQDLPFWAPHVNLLPTGKVLIWPGFFNAGALPRLWDPATDSLTNPATPGSNIFCTGHTFLADGKLLLLGGHIDDNVGLANALTYDAFADRWTNLPNMNEGRWYPTATTLANGDVLVVSGDVDRSVGVNRLPQVYQAASGTWRNLTNAVIALDLYPRMLLAPNGRVFNPGPSSVTRYLDTSGTGTWTLVGNRNAGNRDYAPAVMYADGKVLFVGGGDPPTAAAEVIDLNSASPRWRSVAPMAVARRHHNATLLPDGRVFVAGGTSGPGFNNDTTPVFAAEMWDPASETWSTMASAQFHRRYHSTSLLLPDGRVLTTGGNQVAQVEVYSPPYLFKGTRPRITRAPATAGYGQTVLVETPDAASIAQVTWIRLGAVTHAFDQNQRINRLSFSPASNGLNVVTPSNPNLAPPGHYMIFILNGNGVPSVSRLVQLSAAPVTDGTPPTVALTAPAAGATVSGSVTVSATASDNVAIAGVQFLLDGQPLGNEVTQSQQQLYSTSWATSGAANGTHQLAARARDTAGNITTTVARTVTVSNAGPIAAYSLNETSGTQATDASGSGYHGTLVNGPVWVAAGHSGGALSFDGVNDYVQIANVPHLPQWTISAWVRSPAAPAATAASGPIHREKNFQINWNHSNAAFRGAAALIVGSAWHTASFGALAANTWYHLTATYDGETLRAYTNAVLVTTNTAPSGPAAVETSALRLGRHAVNAGSFRGVIDDVRIYNRAIPLSEIQQNMQTPVGGAPAPPPPPPDTTPPSVAVTAPGAGATVSGTVTISATASDDVGVAGVQFLLDGSPLGPEDTVAPYTYAWDTTAASAGNHALTARARDSSGNIRISSAVTVTVADTTPPAVALTAPAAGTTVSGTVTLSATASDNVGVAGVQFLLDGSPLGPEDTAAPYSHAWNTTAAAPGNHTLTARARDGSDNTTTSTAVTVTVAPPDTTPPEVALTAPAASVTVSGTVTISATASDDVAVAGVQFLLDGSPLGPEDMAAPYSYAWDTTAAAPGDHTLTARARDSNGNTTTSTAVTVTVDATAPTDTTPPSVALSAPAPGAIVSGTVTVSSTASDNVGVVGVQFLLDGEPLGSELTAPQSQEYSTSWTTTGTSNGLHELSVRARDTAGNQTTSAAVSVTVTNEAGPTPIAAYALNEISGTQATDASGSGYHGTLVNGPVWVAAGHSGGALSFDGVNDYVQIASLPYLPHWTISAWVRSPAAPAATAASGPIHREKNFQVNWNHSNAAFRGVAALRVGSAWHAASFGPLAADTWYYLTATYDGETLRAYTNGILMTANEAPSGPALAETSPLRLGRHAVNAGSFRGVIDDVRIYSRALNSSEIEDDMQTPVGP